MIKKIKNYPDNNSLTDSRAIKKEVERVIKVPRTRMSDCTRLVFAEGNRNGWADIDSVPILHPQYPMPPMVRTSYNLLLSSPFKVTYQGEIKIYEEMGINDLVRQVCNLYRELWMDTRTEFDTAQNLNLNDYYLHSIYLRKNGEGWIEFEVAI
jgi:hypothetical protein